MKITLASARVNAGMTQREVAQFLGVSVQTVGSWEKNPSNVLISYAIKLSELYGVAIDNLIFVP